MSKFLNISTDNTLGGNSASDEVVSSQKAIKDYVDNSVSSQTLDGISDVSITSPTAGQNLTYDAVNQVWKNTSTSATVAWGGITGTLEDQTDLKNAFDGKQDEIPAGTAGEAVTYTGTAGTLGSAVIPLVDQTYNAISTNAQSGTAVAEAISGLLADDNTWTGTNTFSKVSSYENSSGEYNGFLYKQSNGTLVIGINKQDNSAFLSSIAFALDGHINLNPTSGSYIGGVASDVNSSVVTTVNKSKTQNGYFKLGNGLIVQWGRISISSYNQTGEVTFPTAFSSANYGIGNTGYRSSVGQGYISLTSQSSTKFGYRMVASATNFNPIVFWVASGY